MNYIVRPGKVYLNIGIFSVVGLLLGGIALFIIKEPTYTIIYCVIIVPMCLLYALISVWFYFKTRIILHEEELIIRTIWTREKRWKYTEITDVYIYKNQGLSNPVVLLKDGKKIVKIVSAYSGYKAFKSVLKEKCNNKIKYIR